MEKKDLKTIALIFLAVLFLAIWLFKIIPVPIESAAGNLDTSRFILGGFYFTSLSFEASVGDYLGVGALTVPFIFLGLVLDPREKKKSLPKIGGSRHG